MAFEDKSIEMAKRLKKLRIDKSLSHEKLAAALKERYGIHISKDSLINYETADKFSKRKYPNNGMKIEYLRCLSDFYDVSTDYLLGITDEPIKTPDIQSVYQYIGLSGACIEILHNISSDSIEASFIKRFFDDLLVHHEIHKYVIPLVLESVLAYDRAQTEKRFLAQYKKRDPEQNIALSQGQQRFVEQQNSGIRHTEDGRYTITADEAAEMYLGDAIGTAQGSIEHVINDLRDEFSKPHLLPLTREKLEAYRWATYCDDSIPFTDDDPFSGFALSKDEG